MTLKRISIELAIPIATYNAISSSTKLAFRDRVRDLKALAVKINEGHPNEEMTVKATMHDCEHDTGGACGTEVDI